jgi:hypothetical protein
MAVLQRGSHALFVRELFIHGVASVVGPWEDFDVEFETFWQRSLQPGPDGKAYQCGHTAMGYSRRELDSNVRATVDHINLLFAHDAQLLQRQRVLFSQ